MNIKSPKVGFVSLGCPKNLVDSERIITKLKSDGYEISPEYNASDLVVVNTCGFLNSAIEESLEVIGEALDENGKVLVTGCLGKKSEMILEKYPNVLGISGPQDYENLIGAVHENLPIEHHAFTSLVPKEGIKLTPRHYAYLKISEGCNNSCTFCIIPDIRGKLKSRALDDVMLEAKRLVNAGVKELLVISQDTSAYGVDIKYKEVSWQDKQYQSRFLDLAKALSTLNVWVRMHYVYPYPHVDKVIPLMADGHVIPYLDIPLQHAAPRILKLMKRPANAENTLSRIKVWRAICPDLTIRSTFIVGFPGETEEEFELLLGFLREAKFDRVGCFTYSEVDGAKANDLPDLVPCEVKEARLKRLMDVQSQISQQRLKRHIGKEEIVIVDEVHLDENIAIARTKYDAPEVDGVVIIRNINDTNIVKGLFVKVKITQALDHDLEAELI
ncbi:30S ribosomal protein S12 methylthiotransferase RimO [Fangia hongkongensis]|uniref:30S ribosomal protein S12 methylthiotransferase RimO n=1 Tax=Fangia hongkongensis TaxID=270495 RepID=UPI00035E3B9A|nr:30S ribosomal protein S12 methylthiotransferase RimO [Fangia hongkongensis]MBK2125965.1 30S ribosomal protein S12 methylthiotransferase RimO [Fangia hongkongensis]